MNTRQLLLSCALPVLIVIWSACSGSGGGDGAGVTGTETRIYGMVLDSIGTPISEARVRLYSVDSVNSQDTTMVSEQVSENGEFSFPDLDPGTYLLRALKDSTLLGFSDTVSIAKGEQKNVDITVVIVIQQNFYITNINVTNLWVDGSDALVGFSGGAVQLLSDGQGGQVIHLVVQNPDGSLDTLDYKVESTGSSSVLVPMDSTSGSSSSASISSSGSQQSSSSVISSSSSSSSLVLSSSSVTCIGVDSVLYGTASITDCRDGQTYKTVKIGDQTWFAQNLNYSPESGGSWCYDNSPTHCVTYGRLYDWATAMALDGKYDSTRYSDTLDHRGVCPIGWHVPLNSEWEILMDTAGGIAFAGETLRESSSLWSENTGTDQYGFSALPGGYYDWDPDNGVGSFFAIHSYAHWWSATGRDLFTADFQCLSKYSTVCSDFAVRTDGYSIRCLKDSGT